MNEDKRKARRTVGLLKMFKDKTKCKFCKRAANLILEDLRNHISDEEINQLKVEWKEFDVTGVYDKFCKTCDSLIEKYKPQN